MLYVLVNHGSIHKLIATSKYDSIRAHHQSLQVLADALNTEIRDYYESDGFIYDLEGSCIDKGKFINRTSEITDDDILIIMHYRVYDPLELYDIVTKFNRVVYYNSDAEFKMEVTSENTLYSMLLKFMMDNPNHELTKSIKDRLVLIIGGLKEQILNIRVKFNYPTYYLPQLLNENYSSVNCNTKLYDLFVLNNRKHYSESVLELANLGYKILNVTKNNKLNHINIINYYDNLTRYSDLIRVISSCKYYALTCTYPMSYEYIPISVSSKFFECYHANTVPIPNLSVNEMHNWIHLVTYEQHQVKFKKWMEDNFRINKYYNTLLEIRECLRK